MSNGRWFTTGGIGWYIVLGVLGYLFLQAKSAVGGLATATRTDPTTGIPVTAEYVPTLAELRQYSLQTGGGGFI